MTMSAANVPPSGSGERQWAGNDGGPPMIVRLSEKGSI